MGFAIRFNWLAQGHARPFRRTHFRAQSGSLPNGCDSCETSRRHECADSASTGSAPHDQSVPLDAMNISFKGSLI
jgi:hypothetical protein